MQQQRRDHDVVYQIIDMDDDDNASSVNSTHDDNASSVNSTHDDNNNIKYTKITMQKQDISLTSCKQQVPQSNSHDECNKTEIAPPPISTVASGAFLQQNQHCYTNYSNDEEEKKQEEIVVSNNQDNTISTTEPPATKFRRTLVQNQQLSYTLNYDNDEEKNQEERTLPVIQENTTTTQQDCYKEEEEKKQDETAFIQENNTTSGNSAQQQFCCYEEEKKQEETVGTGCLANYTCEEKKQDDYSVQSQFSVKSFAQTTFLQNEEDDAMSSSSSKKRNRKNAFAMDDDEVRNYTPTLEKQQRNTKSEDHLAIGKKTVGRANTTSRVQLPKNKKRQKIHYERVDLDTAYTHFKQSRTRRHTAKKHEVIDLDTAHYEYVTKQQHLTARRSAKKHEVVDLDIAYTTKQQQNTFSDDTSTASSSSSSTGRLQHAAKNYSNFYIFDTANDDAAVVSKIDVSDTNEHTVEQHSTNRELQIQIYSWMAWIAKYIARFAWTFGVTSWALTVGICVYGWWFSSNPFVFQPQSCGWISRNTDIANRQSQLFVLLENLQELRSNVYIVSSDESSSSVDTVLLQTNTNNDDENDKDTTSISNIFGQLVSVEDLFKNTTSKKSIITTTTTPSIISSELFTSPKKNTITFNYTGNENQWYEITNIVQPTWESKCRRDDDNGRRRRLATTSNDQQHQQLTPFVTTPSVKSEHQQYGRTLVEDNSSDDDYIECLYEEYTKLANNDFSRGRLWPIWEFVSNTKSNVTSFLDPIVLEEVCENELRTLDILDEIELCTKCGNYCIPPYSLVAFIRLAVVYDVRNELSCSELALAYTPFQQNLQDDLVRCIQDTDFATTVTIGATCSELFHPMLVDIYFGQYDARTDTTITDITYTSSIYPKGLKDRSDELIDSSDDEELYGDNEFQVVYDLVNQQAFGDSDSTTHFTTGYYDTQNEDFIDLAVREYLYMDISIAGVAAITTILAILLHTHISVWLTTIGLFQILLSFPLTYYVYSLQFQYFPVLNFIGIFVVLALGADDIFVVTDKWNIARRNNSNSSTTDIAMIALPDAAVSMFLTTLSTAVAFFGTSICPVVPIRMFAIFTGILVSFDYILCILLYFPALCINDRWMQQREKEEQSRCCFHAAFSPITDTVHNTVCTGDDSVIHNDDNNNNRERTETQPNHTQRALLLLHTVLYRGRWVLLPMCIVGTIIAARIAWRLEPPTDSEVRLLNENVVFEQYHLKRKKLLLTQIEEEALGSSYFIVFGIRPADTGDANDPSTFTELVLDADFDAAPLESQQFLLDFCGELFEQNFAPKNITCPINEFDEWLQTQSNMVQSGSSDVAEEYLLSCNGATSLPMNEASFDKCWIGWSYAVDNYNILQRSGKVKVYTIKYDGRLRSESQFDDLEKEWNIIEQWTDEKRDVAPENVNKFFNTAAGFWWYDTNKQMQETAFGSGGIAISAAALIMLFSSKSISISFFALSTIGFILFSVTAILEVSGWSLGFIEAICFSILIGISCDFVIHFGHAYVSPVGNVNKAERSKFALTNMGPSVLAAAVTTGSSSFVMTFTNITFFTKFGQVLLYTILMATVGSFIVFFSLTNTLGPTHPQRFFEMITSNLNKRSQS